MNDKAAAAPAEPEVLNASKLLDGAIDDMPEVNESAIAVEEEKVASAAAPSPAAAPSSGQAKPPSGIPPIDSKGRLFDPLVHETLPDGSPKLRNNGQLSIRRHPLKAAKKASRVATEAEALPPEPAAPVEAIPPVDNTAQIRAGAATCAGTQLMLMRVALGDKLGQADAEREELQQAWEAVFRHYGMGNFHPVVGLAMVSGGIVLGALQHEETQGKFARLMGWAKHTWLALWHRFLGRRAAADPADAEPDGV